ncbi:hypothetical protein [Campylobacter canadensis]|uniref:Uncharacterized protein n=1 Tax=Campylobacter canadensis TaxID=449520 RepID=A0ABS7WP25_9BACT|nr:hypothetical protein [Campylobacter canadensis]MBZ7986515.1 hypothetical protein [Campylobacter canadensis]MBZ7994080.1 hypothetical protein [Campylobacter canadensis]MBZ7995917.1 hypothetical protein [Campylobacter canadensis]MBZ7997551.1 hypothetical protein [Campylobacter canadensis]MBZ7999411.1 hypothetical protein [Campylobacter canadensis]
MKYFLLILLFFLNSCAYKSLSSLSEDELGQRIYVKTIINKIEPKNSILLGDNFAQYLQSYLNKEVVDNEESDVDISIKENKLIFSPLYYDELGNAKVNKAIVEILFLVDYKNGKKKQIITSGEYIFNLDSSGVISDELKREAINQASLRAFNEFIFVLLNN